MKRFLIRMSTLATVVALGLIAIAQAQRSTEDTAPKAEASEPSALAPLGQDISEKGVSEQGIVDAGQASEPGLFPDASKANPLRAPASEAPPSDVIPTAGESSQRYPQTGYSDNSAGTATSREPAAARPHDPFAVIAAVGTEVDDDQPRADADVPSSMPYTGVRPDLGPAGPTRYPQLGRAGSAGRTAEPDPPSASQPAVTPAEQDAVGPLDRYADPLTATGESREPGRLPLDPRAPMSSLPYSQGTRTLPITPRSMGTDTGDVILDDGGLSGHGTGTPGSRQIEGPQTPQLTVEKLAPEEIQVGKEATFRVRVINTGHVAAHGVEIHDEIPKGTRLVSTSPQSSRNAQGKLAWSLGTVQPGDEVSVEMQVMPEEEGEIGSVATVRFNADASARTIATRPELIVQTSAPSRVLIGEEITLTIAVSNPGSGIATDVVLEEHVPLGLQHAAGEELEYAVGDLKPGDSRQLELTLVAQAPGVVTNVLCARAEANLKVEDQVQIEVLAPQLDVALDGPKRRYLEREATYTLSISNQGTAAAEQVELVAHLPTGLEFVGANNSGQYEAASRTVHWVLEELPVQETGSVRLTTMPIETGEHTLRFTCTGEPGLAIEGEQPVLVEGIAAILFQVVDAEDPIELGGETTYEIRVINQGSKAATNVQLVAMVPPGMRAIAAEGPARHAIDGSRVIFEGLPRLAPKADTTYRVRVQGLQPGDLRLSVQLLTDEISAPVTKEESTRVYSDE